MRAQALLLAAALAAAVPSGVVFCAAHGAHTEHEQHEHATCGGHGHEDGHEHHRIGEAGVAHAAPLAPAPPSRAALPGETAEPRVDGMIPAEGARPAPSVPRAARVVLQV